jgi:hypothetical protein
MMPDTSRSPRSALLSMCLLWSLGMMFALPGLLNSLAPLRHGVLSGPASLHATGSVATWTDATASVVEALP